MAVLKNSPGELCFSSSLTDIVFGTDAGSGRVVLDFICNGQRRNALDETMFADAEGMVTIGDLPAIAWIYARQYLQVMMECSFTDSQGTASIAPVTILYANADVDVSAAAFTETHFLTTLNGTKLTAYGREERIYAYGAAQVSVTAQLMDDNGNLSEQSVVLTPFEALSTLNRYGFSVGPDNVSEALALTGQKIFSYSVVAGERRQDFQVMDDIVPPAPSLMFVNSFGCFEFLHCVGTHRKASKYERLSVRMKGKLRNCRIIEDRQFTANTGWLNQFMADWADELFRSEEVYLWTESGTGKEVVVSDSKSELTNEVDDMPAFEFTYGYAQRLHNVMQTVRAGRIFDNTFDHTFN